MEKFTNVAATVARLVSLYEAREARITAAFKESNSDMEPTRDYNGRFHAPCNGYRLPDGYAAMCEIGSIDEEKLYSAGEYLPEPVFDEEHAYNRANLIRNLPNEYRQKAKAPVSIILELQAADVYRLKVTHGKEWDENGVQVAYAYLEGLKSLVDAAVVDLGTIYNGSKVTGPEVYLEGRQTVTGVIVMVKPEHDPVYGPTVKMMVKTAEGHKFYGTMPKALPMESQGKSVTFTATFKPGKGGMTYYSRPTGASIND
ncbi:hypothetical protein D3C76_103000 [compost metagenome]